MPTFQTELQYLLWTQYNHDISINMTASMLQFTCNVLALPLVTLPLCTSGELTREADSVGSKDEGAKVGQAAHNGANGDGDVARSVLIRQLLPIEVAIHCAREQEQQVCKAARLDCRPSKHIPRP